MTGKNGVDEDNQVKKMFAGKKKKNPKAKATVGTLVDSVANAHPQLSEEGAVAGAGSGSSNTPPPPQPPLLIEYSYEELLDRVYKIMAKFNPDLISGEQKDSSSNHLKYLELEPKNLHSETLQKYAKLSNGQKGMFNSSYLQNLERGELNVAKPNTILINPTISSGSLDGNKALVIKGKFQSKHIENVLINYIKEYVTCHTCRSAQTLLEKEDRLFFLVCEVCGARCSVASIKTGFQAVVGKRAAARAKNA